MRFTIFTFIIFLHLIFPNFINASYESCCNRYVTLVNPVRGRTLWFENSLSHIKNQYLEAKQYGFPVTWLIQGDVLKDKELLNDIKSFDRSNEIGLFVEISSDVAKDARVIFPYDTQWSSPNAIFLSAYSQSDRRKLIDTLFSNFKDQFEYYPISVGAWWIDSYSLEYMRQRYGVISALIVADQRVTDSYGVWGQWWGVPYFPSQANILTPASNLQNKQDVVVIQWAQRDAANAYGDGPGFSNYSLQANDYSILGKDTGYFKEIAETYLDCKNHTGQITVGLETGMEGISAFGEYKNQLKTLTGMGITAVTMSEFAGIFKENYPKLPQKFEINHLNSTWFMNKEKRENKLFGERIIYNSGLSLVTTF